MLRLKYLRNAIRIRCYVSQPLRTNKPERLARKSFDPESHPEIAEIIQAFYKSTELKTNNIASRELLPPKQLINLNGILLNLNRYSCASYSSKSYTKIGKHYLAMVFAMQNMVLPSSIHPIKSTIEWASEILLASSSWNSPSDVFQHIGKTIIHGDMQELDKELEFPHVIPTSHKFSQNFNSWVPQFNYDLIDDSYFTNVPDNIYELPKLTPRIEFNPLYLSNKNDFNEAYGLLFDDEPNPLLLDHLNAFYALGKFNYKFYSSVLDVELSIENKRTLIFNSLIIKSIKNKRYQDYLVHNLNNDDFTYRIFYQYLGLASLEKFPIEWLSNFRTGFELEEIPRELPQNQLILADEPPYQLDYKLSDPRIKSTIVANLGEGSLRHGIQTLMIKNNDDLARYPLIKASILKLLGDHEGTMLLLGNLAWTDYNEFENYIHKCFINLNPLIEIQTQSYIKSLILRYSTIVLPIIKPLRGESKVSLPALSNTTINRFYMLNPTITLGDTTEPGWRSNENIRRLLFSHRDLGKSNFFFASDYYLKQLNLAGNNYVRKLFAFRHFRRFLIEETQFFTNQEELRDLLLNPSLFQTTVNQLWLYLSLLSKEDMEKWMTKILTNFDQISTHLEIDELDDSMQAFVKYSFQNLTSRPAELGEINKSIVVPEIQEKVPDIMKNIKRHISGRRSMGRSVYVEELGKTYVHYIIMKSSIGYAYGESIILTQNIIETFDLALPIEFYQLIGRGVLRDLDCEDLVMGIINDINKRRYIRPFKFDTPVNMKLKLDKTPDRITIRYMEGLTLPIGATNDLTKLTLMPYLSIDHFSETLARFLPDIPDYIRLSFRDKLFQIRHLGAKYHEVLVLKNLSQTSPKIIDDSLHNLYEVFMERFFKTASIIQSPIAIFPFDDKEHIHFQENVIEKFTSTSGGALKLYCEIYDQYLGNLALQNPKLAEEWMKNVFAPLLKDILKLDPKDQDRFIDRLYNDLLVNCPLRPDNMPKLKFRLAEYDSKRSFYRQADFI